MNKLKVCYDPKSYYVKSATFHIQDRYSQLEHEKR